MKTRIKNLFKYIGSGVLLLAAFASAPIAAHAQNVQYILNNDVIPITGSITSAVVAVEGQKIAVQFASVKLTGAGTSGIAAIMDVSNDNSNWSTTPVQFWQAANGATAISHMTNFDIGPYCFLRFRVHNTNSVAVTNSTITLINKKDFR